MHKRLAILGSTGSIGTQTLEIVSRYPELFTVEALMAGNNIDLLIMQAKLYRPRQVVIANDTHYLKLKKELAGLPIEVLSGTGASEAVVTGSNVDTVVAAVVGFAGLGPTAAAVAAGKDVALANKETLVVAGEMITGFAALSGSRLIPIDSEHSAIMQCLTGEPAGSVEKIILTGSGGPFRTTPADELPAVTREMALRHPNWTMGEKITIDSATLMNKGLEVIEAHWLFGIPAEKIEVLIHPQSVIHSMVQFKDGSVKAQMGIPDMRLPIIYALTFPDRVITDIPRPELADIASLTFERPDTKRFRNLDLARNALTRGGNIPCALNAANEVAVASFLRNKIRFTDIAATVEYVIENTEFNKEASAGVYGETDSRSRSLAEKFISKSEK
ncbi:MAG TPA: 1-deoxy-D-xylulose-5-phosphate reductoisomerase [Bacteroidales bacterium]|nr:1-deoxy-D-xylulose-5-phosphate reductoisomerase [Bacteroidales bacterium]